jgi:uncharacterized protein
MAKLTRMFWNPEQRRVPALWRIVLHTLILALIGIVATQLLVSVIPAALLAPGSTWAWPIGASLSALVVAAATAVAGKALDRRSFAEFGFHLDRRWAADFGAGVAIGAILMAGIFVAELGAGWLVIEDRWVGAAEGQPFALALLGPLLVFVAVGFYEELVFRGYHLRNLAEGLEFGDRLGPGAATIVATLVSSAAFGFVHANNPNATVTSTLAVGLAGCMLALGLLWTRELALPIGLHLSWNFCQGNVFGFAVSGNDAGPRVFAIKQLGDPTLTGGEFGPEAGLLGILAMLVGAGLIAGWVRLSRGRIALHHELALWTPELVREPPNEQRPESTDPDRHGSASNAQMK